MTYEPRKDSRSRSYVRRPFAFLFFFRAGAERRRHDDGAPAGRRGRVRGRDRECMYESVATMFFSRTLCC